MKNLPKITIDSETFLKHQHTLPPLPEIIINIQQTIVSDNATVTNISDLILRDPSLTAQVLKIVNSAYYGFQHDIVDIKFAVAYLGIHEIYNMVLSFTVVETLEINDAKTLEGFWEHSLFTAMCTRLLAKKFEPLLSPEQLWIGALLHDIGKLVFFRFFPDHYRYITGQATKNGQRYSEIEKSLPIPKSCTLGILLCKRWQLPMIIAHACDAYTFNSIEVEKNKTISDYKRIIYGSNLMALLAEGNLSEESKKGMFKRFSVIFNISEGELLELMGSIYDLKRDITQFN